MIGSPCDSPHEPRLLVSLATYNEVDNLRPLVEAIRQYAPETSILIIDDNSPDGTGRLADELQASLPEVHVIHRPGKLGLGTATLAAMRFAIENGFDYLLNLDADFSHPPRFIPALLAGMGDHDVMIGSRYVAGGGVEGGFNLKRKLMSAAINGYARLLLGLDTRDNSGAFRCYRVSKLAEIGLDRVRSRGYSFQEEILFWCRQVGCQLGETPILFEDRRAGVSKINKFEVIEALRVILGLGINRALGRARVQEAGEAIRSDRPHRAFRRAGTSGPHRRQPDHATDIVNEQAPGKGNRRDGHFFDEPLRATGPRGG